MEQDILEPANVVLQKSRALIWVKYQIVKKSEVINTMRNKYQLKPLLIYLKIVKSSYCYQNRTMNTPYKYRNLRSNVRRSSLNASGFTATDASTASWNFRELPYPKRPFGESRIRKTWPWHVLSEENTAYMLGKHLPQCLTLYREIFTHKHPTNYGW